MTNPKEIVKELYQMDWAIVDHKMKKINLQGNSIPQVKKECFRFLALCATQEGGFTPSQIVDEYWHMMILHTTNYYKTQKIFGRFIHHVPNGLLKTDKSSNEKNFWNTIDKYEEVFGKPNLDVWGLEKI